MRGHCRIHSFLAACLFAAAAAVAHAASCTISTSGLNFGSYDVFSSLNDDITATINVNCQNGDTYSLALSSGYGSFASRTMTSGAKVLGYNLYSDPTRLTIWGDGSSGTSTVNGTGTGGNVAVPVYGRIPAGQNAAVGSYADTITVTITF